MGGAEVTHASVSDLRWASAGALGLGLAASRLPVRLGPPCPLRLLTGVPCPLCGTTTSVIELLGGDLTGALAANPFGVLGVLLAALLLVAPPARIRVPWAALAFAGLGSWLFQLHRAGLV